VLFCPINSFSSHKPQAVRDFTFIRTTKRHNGQRTVIPAAKVIKFCNLLFNCSIITIVQLAVAFAFHVLMDSIHTLELFAMVGHHDRDTWSPGQLVTKLQVPNCLVIQTNKLKVEGTNSEDN
jgi:hypothetical protein